MTFVLKWWWCFFLVLVFLEEASFQRYIRSTHKLLPPVAQLRKIKNNFWKTLKQIAFQVPRKILCKLLLERNYITMDDEIDNATIYDTSVFNRQCINLRKSVLEKKVLPTLMTRFYNMLPLPFQCGVLVNETLNRFKEMSRVEHVNERSSITKKRKIAELFSKYIHSIARLDKFAQKSMNGKLKELGWLIERTESIIKSTVVNIIPVARLCARLIRKQIAYSDTIKISLKDKANVDTEVFKQRFRTLLPRILQGFIEKRGIKLPLADRYWQKLLRNNFIVVFDKKRKPHRKHVIYGKVFFASHKEGPRNAHLILASMYDYGTDKIQKQLNAEVKFSALLKMNKSLSIDFYEGELFPAYLAPYFNNLPLNEKCFVIDLMAIYSNVSRDTVMRELSEANKLNRNKCSENKRDNAITTPHHMKSSLKSHHKNLTKEGSKKRALVGDSQGESPPTIVFKLTSVEIIMISVLVILLVSSAMFFSVYCLYNYKMHRANLALLYSVSDASMSNQEFHQVNREQHKNDVMHPRMLLNRERVKKKPLRSMRHIHSNYGNRKTHLKRNNSLELNGSTVVSTSYLKHHSLRPIENVDSLTSEPVGNDDKVEGGYFPASVPDPHLGKKYLRDGLNLRAPNETNIVSDDISLKETYV